MKVITTVLKYLALIYILSLERVIGLPFLFILITLIWLEKVKNQGGRLLAILLSLSLMLSLFFNFFWSLAWLLLLLGYVFVRWGDKLVKSKRRRFLLAVLLINIVLIWAIQIRLTVFTLFQLVGSYLLILVWLRIFNSEYRQHKTKLLVSLFDQKITI
ncbi:MAG: hypothetical protein U9O78_00975 [Patescibacteria group bacterium]|nr:hypothetical protein [Patescibacteria group bacterium]